MLDVERYIYYIFTKDVKGMPLNQLILERLLCGKIGPVVQKAFVRNPHAKRRTTGKQ